MKFSAASLILVMTCLAVVGCGAPKPVMPPPETAHGGLLITLPDDQGFIEFLNDKPKSVGGVMGFPLIAYLIQPDKKTPMASPPKEMTVRSDVQGLAKTVMLVLEPDSADALGSARYVSQPGPIEINRGEVSGVIELTLNGKLMSVNFRGKQ